MISIIVPIYNGDKYLGRCIDSVLTQSYSDFELILVNDGSVDNSLNICNEYACKDSRIKVISQVNSGVSSARNNGLQQANGEYVTFVDCDDWLDHDYLEVMYSAFIQHDVDLVITGYREIHSDGLKGNDTNDLHYSDILNVDKSILHLFQPIDFFSFCYPWGKLFKNSFIKDNKLTFDRDISIGEDRLFIYNYLNVIKRKVYVSSQSFYNYYLNSEGAMSLISLPVVPHKYLSNYIALTIMREDLMAKDKRSICKVLNVDFVRSLIRMVDICKDKDKSLNKTYCDNFFSYISYYLSHPCLLPYRLWVKLLFKSVYFSFR